MPDHSPEPWTERKPPEEYPFDGYFRIMDARGRHVATVPVNTVDGVPVGLGVANMARVIACVNACAGKTLEELGLEAQSSLASPRGTPGTCSPAGAEEKPPASPLPESAAP